jgi:DNA-binding NarL/FixJ family response regulator
MPGVGVVAVPTGSAVIDEGDVGETTVVIVDDRRCFAELLAVTLRSVPGLRCVGTASSAAEGIARAEELAPAVVLVNLELSPISGLVVTRRLRTVSPYTAVALMTGNHDGVAALRAAQAGASIVLPRSASLAELIDALRAVPRERVGGFRVARARRQRQEHPAAERELTFRELEVLGYIEEGLPTKRIAKLMGIRAQTCYGYINTVYRKLGVSSRIAAVNRARQLQLI